MHKVLGRTCLPEQRPEVRMSGKSKLSKNLGKSFQVDRKSSKWPQGGKVQLYEDWMESKQSREERLSGRLVTNKVRKAGFLSQGT